MPAWLDDSALLPVLLGFIGVASVLTVLWALGLPLNADPDDQLKLYEVRFLLQTGNIFDRTLPDILQPEPYVTHWPWIVDLPYAGLTAVLAPLMGLEPALRTMRFIVPLLLLAPTLYLYSRLIVAAGFGNIAVALPLAAIFAMRGLFEFAPDRIDYHNLQILLLLATLVLLLKPGRRAAAVNGALTALSLAISIEFAGFYALVMGVYAYEFVFSGKQATACIASFGAALAAAALALFFAIVPPSAYAEARCDAYSAPHMLALVSAGASFCVTALSVRNGGWPARAGLLIVLAAASLAALAVLFPQCLAGPYAALDATARKYALDLLPQEMSLLHRRDILLSPDLVSVTVLFVGALAPAAICLRQRFQDRALVIIALFSLLALLQGVLYFRYLRYLSFFSGIGLLFVVAALLPSGLRLAAALKNPRAGAGRGAALVIPGVGLAAALVAFHLAGRPQQADIPAAMLAGACDLRGPDADYSWPAGASVLSPPSVGAYLLALPSHPIVVAIPNHPAAAGIERAYRFLDPATSDPRAVLDASKATHVVVCAWRGGPVKVLKDRYPFAADMMEGRPPSWLTECPLPAASPLRVYRYHNADGSEAACPSPLAATR